MKIRWQDKIPDTEVLKKANMQSVRTVLKLAQLRWTGHVTRMPDERLPKKVLYGELQEGKRSQGGQKKRYKDTLKASLKDFNIPTEFWERLLRIEQSGVASTTKVSPNLKQRESVKLKGSVKKESKSQGTIIRLSTVRIHLLSLQRELICLLLFTCYYVVSVWRAFLFLWVLGMG